MRFQERNRRKFEVAYIQNRQELFAEQMLEETETYVKHENDLPARKQKHKLERPYFYRDSLVLVALRMRLKIREDFQRKKSISRRS